jgi:hypothetical protein
MSPDTLLTSIFKAKGWSQAVLLVFCGFWGICWIAFQLRDVERTLDHKFSEIDRHFQQIEDNMWTVEMESAESALVSRFNTNIWIPNPRDIRSAVHLGKEPLPYRSMP